jgi:O-antigen/teichoic acid export membrane protein
MNIIKNSSIYILVSIFSGGLSFLLLPILTKYIAPANYGSYEIYRSGMALLQGFMIFGTNTLIFGNYFKWSKEDLKIFLHNSIFIFLTVLLFSILTLLLFPQIKNYFFNQFSIPLFIVLIGIITTFFQSITSLQTTIFQINAQAIKYALFTAGFSLISFVGTYILVVFYKFDWYAIAISILFSSFIFFGITSFNLFKINIKIRSPLSKLKMIAFLGAPLIFTHVSGWVIEAMDKLMISSLIDTAATGNYSVIYKFGLIVFLIQVGVLRAWSAFFYKNINLDTDVTNLKIVKHTYMLIFFLFLVSITVIFISPYLFDFFITGNSYYFSMKVVTYVSFGYFFDGLWKIFNSYLISLNLTRYYSIILIISASCNLILNYFLIKMYGIEGAALSTCISFFIGFILSLSAALYFSPMPWLHFLKINDEK